MALPVILLIVIDLCMLVSSEGEYRYKGESYTIKCPEPQQDALGVYLHTRREVERQVLYYHFELAQFTVHKDYKERVNVSLDEKILTINVWNLQLNDAGAYWCSCNIYFDKCEMTADKGVFLFVNVSTANVMNDLIRVMVLTAGGVLLLLLFLFGVWLVPKITTHLQAREKRGL